MFSSFFYHEQTSEQADELLVIAEAMTFLWHRCDVLRFFSKYDWAHRDVGHLIILFNMHFAVWLLYS